MKHTLSFIFLLLSFSMNAQTVVFPSPERIATKEQIDAIIKRVETLEEKVSNGKPADPEVPTVKDCDHPVKLVEVYDVTGSSLKYNFYSVGVVNMRETIRDASGKIVAVSVTEKLKTDRVTVAHRLDPGTYVLTIENADCKAASNSVQFIVPSRGAGNDNPGGGTNDPPGNDQPPVKLEFVNKGVFSREVNGLLYEWIPTRGVDLTIFQDGRVRIDAETVRKSFDGSRNCRLFLLGDIDDNEIPAEEANQLLGGGLMLPPGNYEFKLLYVNAGSLDEVRKNLWAKIGQGSETARENSAGLEHLKLSITDGRPAGVGIQIPADLYRMSWIPQYFLLPYDLKLPQDKAFGTTRYIAGMREDEIFKKITHLQYRYQWLDYVSPSRKWNNIQALDHTGRLAQPQWVVDHAVIDPNYITIAELAENYVNHENDCPRCYDKAEQVFKGIYDRFVQERGVTSPDQTRLYDDYFGHMYGYSIEVPITIRRDFLNQVLASSDSAQYSYADNEKDPRREWLQRSNYFAKGAYKYRNYRLGGYIGNLFNTLPTQRRYGVLFGLEKANLAMPDRKLLKNGWHSSEAVGLDYLTGLGVWYRLKVDGGEIARAEAPTYSFHTMMAESFYQLLLGNDFILWNSNIPLSTDPKYFAQSWYGEFEKWKTIYKPDNGYWDTYNPDNKAHPKLQRDPVENTIFPEVPHSGENGAFVGAWLYSQIAGENDRVSKRMIYPVFKLNGEKIEPTPGKKGDRSLNSRVSQNPGQTWIIEAYDKKRPILILTEGEKGKALIYQNPFAGLTTPQKIEVEGKTFEITGNRLNVISL